MEELKIDVSDKHGMALLAAIGLRREPVLYRWTTPERGPEDASDEPIEYAVTSLPAEPSFAGYGGVMLWGRYERGWIANPSGRSLVSHLLATIRTLTAERDAARAIVAAAKAYVEAQQQTAETVLEGAISEDDIEAVGGRCCRFCNQSYHLLEDSEDVGFCSDCGAEKLVEMSQAVLALAAAVNKETTCPLT